MNRGSRVCVLIYNSKSCMTFCVMLHFEESYLLKFPELLELKDCLGVFMNHSVELLCSKLRRLID